MAAAGRPRPGRYLALVAIVLIGLYVGLFLGPAKTPALGLDLRGGTQVTLTAHPLVPGGKIDKSALNQAVNIIRQRADGLGVGGAQISTQGCCNIVVAVPGKGRDQVVSAVGQTALLRFRQVLEVASAAAPAATATPSASASATTKAKKSSPKPTASVTGSPKKKSRTNNGDALRSVLETKRGPAARATPSTSPTPAASNSHGTSSSPAASSSPSPTGSGSATPSHGVAAGSPLPNSQSPTITKPFTDAFSALDCTDPTQRNPTQGTDLPTNYILSCGTQADGFRKYILGPAKVQGTQVKSATAGLAQNSVSDWEINLNFNSSGSNAWFDLTRQAYNVDPGGTQYSAGTCTPPKGCNAVAIVLDGVVQSAPTITQAGGIAGGQAQITGGFDQKSSTQLADVLKYGALPLKFTTPQVSSVSATLGAAQLRGGLIAGVIGLGLVIVFSLLYYRALGLVTIGSLAVSGLILYAVTTLLGHSSIGYTLSLPGIAGFIVAVGITADSFVVFFERLRDEVREGRRLRSGVERAWPRARRTILSADTVSLLAAVILYIVSIGDVRGFAFTLGLSTLSDLFIVFFFTKPLITLLARIKAFDTAQPWTGVGKARAGAVREGEPAPARRPREA